jgi:hypothetical protein
VEAAVSAESRQRDLEGARSCETLQVGRRDDRIVGRGDDIGANGQRRQRIARHGVPAQVLRQRRIAAVDAYEVIRHVRQVVEPEHLAEIVGARPGHLLLTQRAPPLPDEVPPIQHPPRLEADQRVLGIEHRTDRHQPLDLDAGITRPHANAQGKVSAQRKAREVQPAIGVEALDAAHRTDHLGDAARVEYSFVQVMARAVIAEVEAQHVEALVEEELPEGQDVEGLRAAFPAMEQHGEALRCRSARSLLDRVMRQQSHPVAAVEHQVLRGLEQCPAAPQHAQPPQRQARIDRLDVRISQPRWRDEVVADCAHPALKRRE